MINVETSFITENRSVYDFLNQPGQGLYIPLYQRDYSWDSDNIEQLLEDITRGIQRLANGEVTDDSKEIRFLGTIITVIENNRTKIYPVDPQAVPTKIEKIIDGQQRVSTLSLASTILLKRLLDIKAKVKESNPLHNDIAEIIEIWDAKLRPMFCFDLQRGTPRLKPKIVRGAKDYWTRDKAVDEAYKSELSNYLGHFIQALVNNETLPTVARSSEGNNLLYKNAKQIKRWLENDVARAHESDNDDTFAKAKDIIERISEDLLWGFERPGLVAIIMSEDFSSQRTDAYILSELVQTISVCHYLLDRCCFTIIQPTDDDWAFDMFQSLNATGTPLTAIETFKPTVVNTVDNEDGKQFKDSDSEKYFKKIEDFLSTADTAQKKSKLTNDFLTSFFVSVDGRTMSNHFSYQRKVLDSAYSDLATFAEKELMIKTFGNYAEFYSIWDNYKGTAGQIFPGLSGHEEADIASMLILFLKNSNHKMAITVLARMYNSVINRESNAVENFISSVKLIASYYFLWRSAFSNSGLDSTYRDFFKGLKNRGETIDVQQIKEFVKQALNEKGIYSLETWKAVSKSFLKYKNDNAVIRLALLAAAHDTQPNEGSIKTAREGTSPYLTLKSWTSEDLRTIEHVAPQTNDNGLWDANLYDSESEIFQSLGNLTLLPQDLNSSAGNKGWKEKQLYYRCVSETNEESISAIIDEATTSGISLNQDTISLLKGCTYNKHLESIAKCPERIAWNADLVNKRTNDMLEIIWERLSYAIS